MNVEGLFDDKKALDTDKQVINKLNAITDRQSKMIVDLEGKLKNLENEKETLNNSIIILKKKIFDIEIENKILSERILELDSIKMTPVESKVSLEEDLETKKKRLIQERLEKKRTLYSSLKTARREIVEKNKKPELEAIQT